MIEDIKSRGADPLDRTGQSRRLNRGSVSKASRDHRPARLIKKNKSRGGKDVRRPPDRSGAHGNSPSTAVYMARMPADWSHFSKRYVAVQRSSYEGADDERKLGDPKSYWAEVVSKIEFAASDFTSSGSHIVNATGLETSRELLKRMLCLREVDEGMCHAATAALFTAFNTTTAEVDMGAVALALATFIQSHPKLSSAAQEDIYKPPFETDTVWVVVDMKT